MSMQKKISRIFSRKKQLEITLEFKKISSYSIPETVDFVDLAVVWNRGKKQINETKGYELNYLEEDIQMDEVF